MNSIVEDILMHYGMPRRSGRYPYGSGENPYQHSGDFLSRVQELKKSGMSETDIAKNMGLTTTQLRTQMSLAKDERRALQVATAKGLREKGYSLNEIADKMGFANDSSVRSLLNETSENRMNQAKATADVLRKLIEEKGMIDVGTGVERELGVSKEKLNQALYMLELEGYPIYGGGVPQVTNPGKQTNIKVICPPGTEHKDIYDFADIVPVSARSGDNTDELLRVIMKYLPYGPQFYDEDTVTDQPERQIVAELIREKALHSLQDEIPHGIAVAIDRMKMQNKVMHIDATIICERDSHKGIIIGKQGRMLKKIGSTARYEIERMLDCKVNLKLWVKVKKDWRDSEFLMKNFGYREEE